MASKPGSGGDWVSHFWGWWGLGYTLLGLMGIGLHTFEADGAGFHTFGAGGDFEAAVKK